MISLNKTLYYLNITNEHLIILKIHVYAILKYFFNPFVYTLTHDKKSTKQKNIDTKIIPHFSTNIFSSIQSRYCLTKESEMSTKKHKK